MNRVPDETDVITKEGEMQRERGEFVGIRRRSEGKLVSPPQSCQKINHNGFDDCASWRIELLEERKGTTNLQILPRL